MKNYIAALAAVLLVSCAPSSLSPQQPNVSDATPEKQTNKLPELNFVEANFSNLPNWKSENFINFAQAYKRSCNRILKKDSQKSFGKNIKFGKNQEWQIACRRFEQINTSDANEVRQFFETYFIPYQIDDGGDVDGLFTGYFEASLKGSRQRSDIYKYPLRARPDDLVMVDLGRFRDELKGQRIAGRVQNGRLSPYESHADINAGQLPVSQDKPLVWVDSAIDAFFLQIQGSGIVTLDDGSIMRVGYAGQNGHPYYAVGRELIKQGALTKETVSMQSIRGWMEQNPDQAQNLMETNKSYVFFREIHGEGPLGAEGVALTPERSLAVDRTLVAYGIPVWLSAENPSNPALRIDRLMVAQDTGGAIKGVVRGDYFWGYGDRAEQMAGVMKSSGRYWFLLPKSL